MIVAPATEKKPESKIHKSLADILGIPKRGDQIEQPKVAVVIDPKLAKILRPHQIEGVKVIRLYTPLTVVYLSCYNWENSS